MSELCTRTGGCEHIHPPPIPRLREPPTNERTKRIRDREHEVYQVEVRSALPLVRQICPTGELYHSNYPLHTNVRESMMHESESSPAPPTPLMSRPATSCVRVLLTPAMILPTMKIHSSIMRSLLVPTASYYCRSYSDPIKETYFKEISQLDGR